MVSVRNGLEKVKEEYRHELRKALLKQHDAA